MDVFYERCAGLDVHKEWIHVCALIGQGRKFIKKKERFSTFPDDLVRLSQWLVELGVTHVVMESTGVYWMAVYDVLEGRVQIVVGNAQHIMNVPGRKTDETDAEWLAKLLRHGLVTPSFVPERSIRELRQWTRYRRAQVNERSRERNRVEKHLQIAGVKLSSVASDVFGVSGTNILAQIAAGTTDPTRLAGLARGRLRKKIPQLERALRGPIAANVTRMMEVQIHQLDRIEATIAEAELAIAQRMECYEPILERLNAIPGVDRIVAIDILAEIGTDMSPWLTHRKLTAMAGVAPANYISAGKRLKHRSRQGNPYLKSILVQAASAAIKTQGCYYQAKYARLKQRRGHKRAVLAIAHKILIAIYYILKRGEAYRERGAQFVAEDELARKKNHFIRQLEHLGYSVALTASPVA